METRSSLELMLERIQRMDDRPEDPPPLPVRPGLPPGRRSLPIRGGHFKGRRTNKEDSVHQEFLLVAVSVPDSIEECALKKMGKLGDDDTREREREREKEKEISIQVIVGIQKCFRAHQARYRYHELKRGIITLQSFLRGEIARKNYQLMVERQTTAAIFLQCAVRGCLARKNLNRIENANIPDIDNSKISIGNKDSKNQKSKDYIKVPYADVVELQRCVWRAEAELGNKKEENVFLKLQIEQFEKKWQLYEAKMKSMEELWQDQLTSIQVNLARKGERSPTTENTTPQRASLRLNTIAHFIEQHQDELNDDDDELELSKNKELKSSGQVARRMDPEDELKRLENQFEEWEKEYRMRLRETKTNFLKLGKWRMRKNHKWWWERRERH